MRMLNLKISVLLMLLFTSASYAQKEESLPEIQSIREEVIKFLQEEGELGKNKNAEYLNSHVNIFEVVKKEPLGFGEIGIFGFRSSNAPSVTYVLLKSNSTRKILDVQNVSATLSEALEFMKEHNFSNSQIVSYCEEILNIYKYNRYDFKSKM